jgi:hypothetical protein
MCSLFNQHSVCSMICNCFKWKKTEIHHGGQIVTSLRASWTDNCISFIIFVLQVMGNKAAYSTQRRASWTRKVFKHPIYPLNSSCPLKMPLNQIKIALLSKSRINFPEFPSWKGYFYLWSHLILKEFNLPFFKVWLGVL